MSMWQVLFICQISYAYNPIISTFEDHQMIVNHLAVNYNTGTVYVGAINKIYQLSADLNIVQIAVTGPVNDSVLCSFECDGITLEPKDNFNKVLVIDYVHHRLITCGSVFQGMCSIRSLRNIHIARDVPAPVVANDPTASTVAFLAPGPPNPNTTQVMYTGVTFTGSLAHRYHVPAVSSRTLEDYRLFDVAKTFCEFCHSDQVTGTRLYINTMYRDQYIVNYVYGFSSGEFSYFLTTQQRTGGGYHSKIIRICHSDELYDSYTEIPVVCKQNENSDYNLVEAGFVTNSSDKLAKNLGILTGQDVLYTLFRVEEKRSTSSANISALCIYSIQDINERIGANIEKCFDGEGMRGLEYVWPNRKCTRYKLGMKGADYCGSNINSPLGGDLPIETRPMVEFNETLTALAVTVTNAHTKVFVGTAQGHLKHIVMENATSASEHDDIVIDEGSSVHKDLFFDIQRRHLYVMTKSKVSKVKVHLCNEHKSCSSCLGSGDFYNYCGWCFIQNKCSPRSDCKDALGKALFWLPYGLGPCTVPDQETPVLHESIVGNFTDTTSTPSSVFNHMVVDRNTGSVYVGAVNKIYQLSPKLDVSQWVVSGPVNESNYCSNDCLVKGLNNSKDNINKVLLIDYTHRRLITCGTILNGICSIRDLFNISQDYREVREPMGIITDVNFSPVAFIVTIPANPLSTQVMYLGALNTNSSGSNFPVISSRSLEDHDLFKISYNGLNTDSTGFSDHFTENFLEYGHSYVYGWSSGQFSYFLRTHAKRFSYYTTIVRVCHQDDKYSYIEIPISCEAMTYDGKKIYSFNYVVAAFVGKPGLVLAEELEITVNDDILFAIFRTRPTSTSSTFCIYSLKKISQKFRHNTKMYFSEIDSEDFNCSPTSEYCQTRKLETENFCEPNINMPLWGNESIVAMAVATYMEIITAVVAMTPGNYTLIFAGTAQGHLKKIVVESATSAFEFDDIVIDEGSPINKDLLFDVQQEHLYVMTKHKVFKAKVYQCSEYKSCSTCVRADEVYCGWCIIAKKCRSPSECEDSNMGPLYWLPHNSTQCNAISQTTSIQVLVKPENTICTFIDTGSAPSSHFNHLVVDRNSGYVYVGAVNRIHQLLPDLKVLQQVITGPVNESSNCLPDCPRVVLNNLTDNMNKVLQIDYKHNRLVTCGSVLEGICSVRVLFNISHDVEEATEPILLHNSDYSPMAFIAPDLSNPLSTQVMYLGVESLDDIFPVVTSRSLKYYNLFEISYNGLNTNTSAFFNHFNSELNSIHFTYGFSSGQFNYFIKIGTNKAAGSLRVYFTKIVSVCYKNDNYAYTEIPISCKKLTNNGKKSFSYSHMMAAFVGKPGLILAKKLRITVHDDVLFGAFHSGPGLASSALCIYPLKKIRQTFMHNIKKYYSEITSQGLNCSPPSEPCNTTLESITEDFCGPDINTPLWGQEPVEAAPVAIFTTKLTALAATAAGDYTVVFAGTDQGRLKKIVVKSAVSAFEYDEIIVDEGSPVNKDMFFDTQQMYLYVMTERKVSKVKVQQCSEYKSYIKCVGSRDPYCGWCEDEEKCGPRTECE